MGTSGLRTPSGARLNCGTPKAPRSPRWRRPKNLERRKKFQGVGEIFLSKKLAVVNRSLSGPLGRPNPARAAARLPIAPSLCPKRRFPPGLFPRASIAAWMAVARSSCSPLAFSSAACALSEACCRRSRSFCRAAPSLACSRSRRFCGGTQAVIIRAGSGKAPELKYEDRRFALGIRRRPRDLSRSSLLKERRHAGLTHTANLSPLQQAHEP
jgi:hypothetical protein